MRNNNQKVIRRLSARSLANSRVRNRIAVLAIALTSLLFTGIFTFLEGSIQITEEETMRELGTRTHAGLKDATWEQMERIVQNPEVKAYSWNIFIGIADNIPTRQSELRYASGRDELENSFVELEEGTMPRERLDLIADTIVLEALGVEPKLGAQVPVSFEFLGEPHRETFTLCGWYRGSYISHASELYLSETYWEELRAGRTDGEFTAIGEADPKYRGMGLYSVNLWFRNAHGIEERVRRIIEEAGYEPGTELDYGVNWAYMSSRADSLDTVQIVLLAGALFAVILTGYLIIHNIFQISIRGDIRFYGLLKTVGTTGKQIRKLVRRQAWILSAVGIPLGLCLGFILCKHVFPFATGFLDLRGMEKSVVFRPWIALFGALFSLVTVYFSCRKPARVAAKVSPIEAVRYTEGGGHGEEKRRKRGRRTEKKSGGERKYKAKEKDMRSAGPGGRIPRMALANLGRNKGKTCAVVLSMTFSIVLLALVLTVMNSFRLDSYIEARMTGDFLLANTNLTGTRISMDMTLDEAYIAEADKQQGITARDEIWARYGGPKLHLSEAARKKFAVLDEQGLVFFNDRYGDLSRETIEKVKTGEYGIYTNEYAYTPELLERIPVLEGTFDAEKFQSGNYVLVGNFYGNTQTDEPLYHVGETITVGMATADSEYEEELDDDGNTQYVDLTNTQEKEYEVMAVVDLPTSMRDGGISPNSFDLVLPLADVKQQSEMSAGQLLAVAYEVEPEFRESFEHFAKQYTQNVNPQMGYLSADSLRTEFSRMIRSVGLIGVLLAAVVALVGILNFLNSVLTGIQARRREFAMLQSIGMSGKQLRRLLIYEGVCYALISGVLGIALGSVIGYFAVGSLERMILFFRYRYTALPYLILLPVFLALSMLLPSLACRRLARASIVERLREAET